MCHGLGASGRTALLISKSRMKMEMSRRQEVRAADEGCEGGSPQDYQFDSLTISGMVAGDLRADELTGLVPSRQSGMEAPGLILEP